MTSVKKIEPVRVVIEHDENLKYYQVSIEYKENGKRSKHLDKNKFEMFIDALLAAMALSQGHRVILECLI
jgi:hypothetical protein